MKTNGVKSHIAPLNLSFRSNEFCHFIVLNLWVRVKFVSLNSMLSLEKTIICHAFYAYNKFIKNATVFS